MKTTSRIALPLLVSLMMSSAFGLLIPVHAVSPSISLTLTPSATVVLNGTAVSYLYNATNTGDIELTGAVYDDVFGLVGNFVNLYPGGWVAFNVTHVLTQNTTNVATAYGVDQYGTNVTDSATAFVRVLFPEISVDMTCLPEEQFAPGTITWNVTVTNTGDVSLKSVNVTDTRHGYLGSIGTLNPDETVWFAGVDAGLPPDTYYDNASAFAAYEGGTVSDWDDATCVVKRVPADVNGDGIVDMKDIAIVAQAFGSKEGDARWNPAADVNHDGVVDLYDIALVAREFWKQ